MKRKLLFAAIMIASALGGNLYAQLDANKVYTIQNYKNDGGQPFMQDNGTGVVVLSSLNDNSYWKFVPTGNANCYYIQNSETGKYIQGYSVTEQEVAIGDNGVEYYIKADETGEYAGCYRMSSTANSPYTFVSGTLGLNWKGSIPGTVQSFTSLTGGNPRSAWIVKEKVTEEPQFDATKTYVISNCKDNNGTGYLQDNGNSDKVVAIGTLSDDSYWQFVPTGQTNRYYVQNATTKLYLQSCVTSETEIMLGTTPVEYNVALCAAEGDGIYGIASTDQTTFNFTSGTLGLNWKEMKDNGRTFDTGQAFAAVAGTNHRSFWKIVEQAMPTPNPDPSSGSFNMDALEQWMTGLNDNLYISQMSLPGAHDAATQSLSIGKCQDKDIAGLWDAGVRVFDLRPTDSGNDCTINHGTLATNTTLRAALTTITGRLSTYGSEFAVVLMRKEADGDSWASKVASVINSFSDYVIPFSPSLRLGDVRGKVIVLSRDEFASGYTISYWDDNSSRSVKSANGIDFVVQDYYKVEDNDTKSTAITNLLAEARKNTSSNRMFINHTSGYVPGLIPGLSDDITGNANTCNTLALNTIDANPGPTGIIMMDYAGSSSYNGASLCSKIIEQNGNISISAPSEPVTGQYYVYNVEREMYITRSNDYATRGGFDKAGMVIAVNNAGDGTLTLVANVNGDGKGIFISDDNGNIYVDNAPTVWTFECIDNAKKIYTLKNGDKYLQAKDGQTRLEAGSLPSNKSAQWQFIPRNVREDLSVASSSNPVDVTYLIENQGFDRYDGEQDSWKNADNSNWRPGNGWCHDADGSNNCAEVWNANFDIHQSFTGLKNGVYELRVQGYYRMSEGNNSDYLISQMSAGNTNIQRTKYYINDTEAYLLPQLSATLPEAYSDKSVDINGTTYRYPNGKGKASIAFREGYYENEPIQTIVTDGSLTIGMKLDNKNGEDWNCFDNFRLYYLGLPDLSQFTDALEAAITAAQAYSGQTTTALQTALDAALAEAIAVRQSLDTDELTAKTNALNTARANAEAADVTFLAATIPFAQADGVDVTDAINVLANGTTAAQVNNALSALRLNRRIANAETQTDVFTGNEPAAGDFYLYNVGTGRFFCGGADWGAHAALGFPGIIVTLEATDTEGVYKLNTHLTNGTDGSNKKEYLNYNGYCDTWTSEAWKFVSQGDGKYNIVRSANEANLLGYEGGTYNNVITSCVTATGATNQWKLVTKADRDALLATATETAPQDASYLIKSPNFSQREDVSAWTFTNASVWGRGANHPDFAIESYNNTSAIVEQTVSGLPAGTYELKVQAFYRDGNFAKQADILAGGGEARQLATLYAGTKSALIQNVSGGADQAPGMGRSSAAGYMPDGIDDACLYFQSGLYWATLDEIVVGQDGTMTIGARKTEKLNDGDWMVLDNFRLIYKGAGIDLSGVKTDLLAKINEATTLLNDLDLNLSFLATAKNNGQDVYDNSTDADEIVEATNALQTAINQVNGVADVTAFKQTLAKAEPEGVAVNGYKAAVEAVTDGSAFAATVADQLYLLRSDRKVNALRMPDIYTGSAPAAGKVYLFNVGTGMFLGAGSDYNSHAAVDQVGIEVELVADGENFKVKTPWGGLSFGAYVDAAQDTWHFIPVSGKANVYNISSTGNDGNLLGYDANGPTDRNVAVWNTVAKDRTGFDNEMNQWKIITPGERKALIAAATTSNPVDVSYLISDPCIYDVNGRVKTLDSWTKDVNGGNSGAKISSGSAGRAYDYGYEFYDTQSFSFSQTLTGLTPGKYEVAVQGFYRDGDGGYQAGVVNNGGELKRLAYLKANNETAQLPNIASVTDLVPGIPDLRNCNAGDFPNMPGSALEFFEAGGYWTSVQVTVGNDGNLTIGVAKDSKQNNGDWVVLDNFRLRLLEADKASANMKITDAKYATFIAPFDVEIPAGVTASTAEIGADGATLELSALEGTIPAHTAVILFSENAYENAVSGVRAADAVALTTGALVGTYEDIQAPDGSYVLQSQNGKVGFYQVEQATATPWVRANRAYLTAPANPVKAYFFEDAVDGIQTMDNGQWTMDNAEIFNVAGQRMNKLQRGVNIVNGKKVLVK